MTDEEILSKSISLSVEANKKLAKKECVGLHDLSHESVEMAESISYHAVKGVFPEKIFKHRSPNETQKESDYIKANYKQITFPVFNDYIATIGRPMGDGNWSIHYNEDKDEYKTANKTFQAYVETGMPTYGSLEGFIKFILPSIKSIDANGFLAIRPKEIKYSEVEENGEKVRVVDSSELHEPTIFFYESKNVVDFEKDEYYLFLSKEKSEVIWGGRPQMTGSIYELYTKDAVYFIIQYGQKNENLFITELFYQHNLDECPVHQLMGVPHLKCDKILWQSPFYYSCDLLDLVATNSNWMQAMINKCVFPVQVMFGSVCDFRDSHGEVCQDGVIIHDGKTTTCPSCHGQGVKSRISPLGTLLINPATKFEPGEEKSSLPPLQYVSPEVHTLEFIHKKVESDTLKARSILKLRNKNTTVNTSDGQITATEITDDAKSMQAFIKPISDQIFTIYEFCLKMIGKQRYGESFIPPALSYPKTFDFKSAEDYLNDISNAIKIGLPPSFIQTILMQYINAYYGDNEKANKIFKLVIYADKLFGLSQDDINMKLSKGTAAKWEDILHSSALNIINEAVLEDEKFTEKDIESQVEEIISRAKAIESEISSESLLKIYNV